MPLWTDKLNSLDTGYIAPGISFIFLCSCYLVPRTWSHTIQELHFPKWNSTRTSFSKMKSRQELHFPKWNPESELWAWSLVPGNWYSLGFTWSYPRSGLHFQNQISGKNSLFTKGILCLSYGLFRLTDNWIHHSILFPAHSSFIVAHKIYLHFKMKFLNSHVLQNEI